MSKLLYFNVLIIGSLLLFVQCKDAPVRETIAKEIKEAKQIIVDSAATLVKREKAVVAPIIEKDTTATEKIAAKVAIAPKQKEVPEPVKKKVRKRAKIKFDGLVHKFGTIKTGDKISHQFKFKNTGNAPLVIKSVDVSCGCTFPSYPFLPIEPGKEGAIDVTFDSEHKIGRQKPTITVVTNGRPRTIKLNLEGFVE